MAVCEIAGRADCPKRRRGGDYRRGEEIGRGEREKGGTGGGWAEDKIRRHRRRRKLSADKRTGTGTKRDKEAKKKGEKQHGSERVSGQTALPDHAERRPARRRGGPTGVARLRV